MFDYDLFCKLHGGKPFTSNIHESVKLMQLMYKALQHAKYQGPELKAGLKFINDYKAAGGILEDIP